MGSGIKDTIGFNHQGGIMRTKHLGKHFTIVWIAIIVFLSIAFSIDVAKAQEGLKKIADNVYSYVDIRNASPQNSFGANAGVVVGRDGILVIHTLISSKKARNFLEDIRTFTDKPIKYVVNSHSHLDHSFGNSEFEKQGAVIIAHQNSRKDLQLNGESTMKRARGYGLTDNDLEGTTIALPKITFSEKMEIDLGGQMVILIYPGPSHTDGSVMVYIPDKKILFAGDILFTDYHPNLVGGDIDGWIKALDYIMSLDVNTIVPGHGPMSGKKDISDMREYLITFDKKAKELCAKSKDVEWIVSEMKKALPQRRELDMMIKTDILLKYMKKDS
jgi:glyoxylase-like metal-dependent hydrolase (beta-lactamase superfamily II)